MNAKPLTTRYPSHARFWHAVAISFVIHLIVGYWAGEWWQEEIEEEEFRVRLAHYRAQLKPRRLETQPSEAVGSIESEMEYLSSQVSLPGPDAEVLPEGRTVPSIQAPDAPTALREFEIGTKEETPTLAAVKMVSPRDIGVADSVAREDLDLLRMRDMARANRFRSGMLADADTPIDISGYVNFTRLNLYGAGSDSAGSLDMLARYLRDRTGILAQVRDTRHSYFSSEELLKDPVHFFVEGHGRLVIDRNRLTKFAEEETALLGRYLREGGFLFIEGSNRYNREMIAHIRTVLGNEGSLAELPASHPVYHSYYSFDLGFPGERKGQVIPVGFQSWYYPDRNPAEFYDTGAGGGKPAPNGLYGVEFKGDLVAIVSDLGLARRWRERPPNAEIVVNAQLPEELQETARAPIDNIGALKSATNIVVFALNRSGGLTPSYEKPAWANIRPELLPEAATELAFQFDYEAPDYEAPEVFDDLDAYIAFVQSPLGERMQQGEMTIRLDAAYSLNLLQGGMHGIMLHNLPPGKHWVEVTYGGKSQHVEVELRGGKVLTMAFALNRLAFFTQLRVRPFGELVEIQEWRQAFGDLQLDEVFLEEDREVLDSAADF